MNNRRTILLPKIILGQLFVGAIMASIAFSILFYAEGYRFNFKKMSTYKTGIISVYTYPRDAQVYLDSKLVKKTSSFSRSPFRANLRSGYYNVMAIKEGYVTWEKTIKVEAEKVANYGSVILFKSNVLPEKLNDTKKIDLLLNPNDFVATKRNDKALIINGSEIWYNNSLITRFSTQILNANWYYDREHILIQSSNEIRIIDIDGSNNVLLVKLKENLPTQFVVNSSGDELYYRDGSDYMVAHIR